MKSIKRYWNQLNIKTTELIGVAIGAFIYSMTYNYLLLPSHLGEGGAMGVTALLYYAFQIPSYLSNLLINTVLIALGYRLFEKKTTYLTIWAIAWMTVFLKLPVLYSYHTHELIVPTLLAGALTGISIGLIFRYNGTIAGDTIIGKLLNYFFGMSVGTGSLLFDLVIVIPFIMIIGFTNTILTVIYLYVYSVFTNQFMANVGARKAVLIVSPRYQEIATTISKQLGQEITIFNGTGFYSSADQHMLYMIASPRRVTKIVPIIEQEDKNALIVVENIRSTRGLNMRRIL
ncbi:YitT family protein [Lentilactobacillus sp. TOM.63]|uniref:YitT family protein n=1 Tax=Lentilactobacillus TaxID=2767893 RepID=UPI001C252276|nr:MULTISPECIES: YitT family protein [Lentilactobacillus]MBU9789151.1 YitT family protein [Lentilactobacillus dabitei]MDM7515558.1 YitT family protein [Lentilactobacillus sp. TOM.63]